MKEIKQIIVIIIFILFIIVLLCSCQKRELSIDVEKSFYSNYKIENNKVYIYCNVLIINPNKKETSVVLTGIFDNDKKNGLLKESILNGYATNCKTKTFEVKKGDNWIEVVFIGNYAGKKQKYDRTLPKIIISEQ